MDISNLIKESYIHYITDNREGLVLAPFPTAIGKTYSACQAIAELVKSGNTAGRKILFVTPLKKNLPDKDMRTAFESRGMDYENQVVKVLSNEDCIREAEKNFIFNKVPDSICKLPCCVEMRGCLKKIDDAANSKVHAEKELARIQYMPSFSSAERQFRDAIHKLLCNTAGKNKCTIEEVIAHEQFSWVGEIYPQVSERYSVYMMSMHKLLMGQCRIVKKYGYMSEEWLKDKIIFIDEWDSTKEDIISYLLNPAENDNRLGIDLMHLFASITSVLNSPQSFSEMPTSSVPKFENYRKQLIREAEGLDKQYRVTSPYHYAGEYADRSPYFLYFCSSWLTATREKDCGYVWAVWNESAKAMDIHIGDNEQWHGRSDESLSLNDILGKLNAFIRHFVQFISYCALQWSENETKERLKKGQPEFTYTNAVNSLLYKFRLSEDAKRMLLDSYQLIVRPSKEKRHVRPYSYYKGGATWFSLNTGEDTFDDTIIRMVKLTETAESIMLYLSRHALVIGLSATATCPTILGNYSLRFLAEELNYEDKDGIMHHDFHNILIENKSLAKAIQDYLAYRYRLYGDKIKVVPPVILENTYNSSEYPNGIISTFVPSRSIATKLGKRVDGAIRALSAHDGTDDDDKCYIRSRYYNIIKVMFSFAGNREHQSCLCIGMKLPGDEKSTLCLSALDDAAKIINKYYSDNVDDWGKEHGENISVFVIDSENFPAKREEFDRRLEKGERLFAISTFKTIAAGQNMQHPVCEWVKPYLERLDDEDGRDISKKDIDELAILDLTHNVVNTADYDNFGLKEQLTNIIQLEECYEECAISEAERREQIVHGFRVMPRGVLGHGWIRNVISNTTQPGLQSTHWVVQTDGRTKRSPWRTRSQQIYIDRKVLYSLDEPYLKSLLPYMSPELRTLYGLCCGKEQPTSRRDTGNMLEARKITLRGHSAISRMLRSINLREGHIEWKPLDHDEWVRWRNLVLRHPGGIDSEIYNSDIFFRDYYIPAPKGKLASSCLYYQVREFNEIDISYKTRIEFEKRLKESKKDAFVPNGISEVSESASRLPILMRYKGRHKDMETLFKERGWATKWNGGSWLISPVLYQEIYLGALGEVAGQHILEDMTSWRLKPIEDLNKFEAFDAVLDGLADVYVDFKYYKYFGHSNADDSAAYTDEQRRKIRRKMDIVNAKAVFIIGIIAPVGTPVVPRQEGDVYYVPDIMFEDGSPDRQTIEWIDRKLSELKAK